MSEVDEAFRTVLHLRRPAARHCQQAWLTQPDDKDMAEAREELDRVRAEMNELVIRARAGLSVALVAAADEALRQRHAEAERRFQTVALPPVVRPVAGPVAKDRWFELGVEVQREIVRSLVDIVVEPVGRRSWQAANFNPSRLTFTWKRAAPTAAN
jgi:hypothetical protein